jgi:hypothetical protein
MTFDLHIHIDSRSPEGHVVESIVARDHVSPEEAVRLALRRPDRASRQSKIAAPPIAVLDDVEELSRTYSLSDHIAVSRFLLRNPGILVALREAYPYIVSIWGQSTRVNLDIRELPDGNQPDALMAYIQTTDHVENALAKLRQFTSAWWGQRWASFAGTLNFDVEHVDAV